MRHAQKTAPRPQNPTIGRDKSKVVNDEIVEFRKADDPMEVAEKANAEPAEPEVLDRQMRVSRNVEEHELENAIRSLPQHGSRMKELLLQVFNLEDPETAAPGLLTGGYCFLVIGYECIMNGETAISIRMMLLLLLMDC